VSNFNINISMLIIDNAITESQIDSVRQFVSTHPKTKYTNWVDNGQVIDNRWNLNIDHANLLFIKELVASHFDSWDLIWSAYQIQTNPHHIHIDEYGKSTWPEKKCWTYVLAFDTVPEFKTIIWQEEFRDGQEFAHWIEHVWAPNRANLSKSNISQQQALEHTFDENNQDYVADYLTLEGVFEYKKGSAVLFDGNKLHCTNNWRKYPQFTQRELLQIHVISNAPKMNF
jgi:hypothetical protein